MRVQAVSGTRSAVTREAVGQLDRACARCGTEAVDTIDHRHTFRYGSGESAVDLTVNLPVRRCGQCGFEFLDRESERIKLEAICEHLGILSPAGIRRIRENYGMTQAAFADVTGLGTATLVRWENGSMNHTRAYDRYMRLLESPEVMGSLKRLVQSPRSSADVVNTGDRRFRVRTATDDVRRQQSAFVLRRAA